MCRHLLYQHNIPKTTIDLAKTQYLQNAQTFLDVPPRRHYIRRFNESTFDPNYIKLNHSKLAWRTNISAES